MIGVEPGRFRKLNFLNRLRERFSTFAADNVRARK